jgi:hypothetical protein
MIFDDKGTYFFRLFPIVFFSNKFYSVSKKERFTPKAIFIRAGASMKRLVCPFAFGLSMMVGLGVNVSAQTADINIKVTKPGGGGAKCEEKLYTKDESKQASQSLKLYYIRYASVLKGILDSIATANPCIAGTVIEVQGDNTIVLYGKEEQRKTLQRVITVLDLPRERVNMEMWGILISSNDPQQLAEVMRRVNKEIDTTQKLLRETYKALENGARDIKDEKIDQDYKTLFEDTLGYKSALDPDRSSLSMIDILLRINAADDPVANNEGSAENICKLFKKSKYEDYVEDLAKEGKHPFSNYLEVGLLQKEKEITDKSCKGNAKEETEKIKLRRQKAVLDFSLQYSELRDNPAEFNAPALQQSAESLNALLNPLIDAINRDVEELFIKPTLTRIQKIVGEYGRDVSYAEVGKTSVAGLNGLESTVASTTVSAFDETGPLRLNELISEAGNLNSASKDLLPGVQFGESTIPVASLVSVVAALSKDRSLWRGLTSGVSLSVTPSVLRNSESAELKINLITAPTDTQEKTGDGELRPLSRISQNKVTTSVYVNTLDLFALSTFNSQTTIDGGRWYIPVIGTVWKGMFSGIPVFGDLFSIKNDPKNVQHQSIVLTNSFIVPTAMGIAHLYNSNSDSNQKNPFYARCVAVETYMNSQKNKLGQSQAPSNCVNLLPPQFPTLR